MVPTRLERQNCLEFSGTDEKAETRHTALNRDIIKPSSRCVHTNYASFQQVSQTSKVIKESCGGELEFVVEEVEVLEEEVMQWFL